MFKKIGIWVMSLCLLAACSEADDIRAVSYTHLTLPTT